ncbi:MAG TPA: divalent-cation tolerance protein CutA [Actinomycetota bacterium]
MVEQGKGKGIVPLQVTVAVPDEAAARRLAEGIVTERLAAAVQVVGPVWSVFWWQGERHRADEWLCLAKTTAARFQRLAAYVREHHAYEVPEVIAVPVSDGNADYLAWLGEETGA